MNVIRKIMILCLLAGMLMPVWAKDYQMTMFGIKSDGTTMNTRSIQKAIDFISESGGGRLVFTVGRYLTGSIHLKSNVTIHLGEGAVLVGSTNPYDYDMELNAWYGLILANKQDNIGITGKGVIDGRGRELANNFINQVYSGVIKDKLQLGRVANRPKLVYFRECKNVEIKGVTMMNPAFWTQTYDQCENLLIDGITVHSRAYWNNDGMDIVDCNGALIQNCYVDATDDAICLKSHSADAVCQNIEVRNNTACSSASGIKFGTASTGGFKNIKIINNTIFDTFRSAITIQAVDGGLVENIVVAFVPSIPEILSIWSWENVVRDVAAGWTTCISRMFMPKSRQRNRMQDMTTKGRRKIIRVMSRLPALSACKITRLRMSLSRMSRSSIRVVVTRCMLKLDWTNWIKFRKCRKLILNSLSIRSYLPGDFMSAMSMGSLSRM